VTLHETVLRVGRHSYPVCFVVTDGVGTALDWSAFRD
jgi:hypothetical protein